MQIFDLLDSVLPVHAISTAHPVKPINSKPGLPRNTSAFGLSGAYGSTMSLAAMANGGGGVLTRRVLTLKNDPEGNGKYVAGLNEIRVRTREVR